MARPSQVGTGLAVLSFSLAAWWWITNNKAPPLETPRPASREVASITNNMAPTSVVPPQIPHRSDMTPTNAQNQRDVVEPPNTGQDEQTFEQALDIMTESNEGSVTEGWSIGPVGVRSAIQAASSEMHDCIEDYSEQLRSFEGSLLLTFDITPDSEEAGMAYPVNVDITGINLPGEVLSCAANVYGNLPFRTVENEEMHVEYPLYFSFDDD